MPNHQNLNIADGLTNHLAAAIFLGSSRSVTSVIWDGQVTDSISYVKKYMWPDPECCRFRKPRWPRRGADSRSRADTVYRRRGGMPIRMC